MRKAAYQEYVVAADYNVARVPADASVKASAAVGVAFVTAAVSLGISFGLDFTRLSNAPQGPDLYEIIRIVDEDDIPEDVSGECLDNVPRTERPKTGDWLAIWGGETMKNIMERTLTFCSFSNHCYDGTAAR